MIRFIVLVSFFLCTLDLFAQEPIPPFSEYGELLKTELSSAPFPHPERGSGHTHGKQFYATEKHYNDSSVALFIPKGFWQPIAFPAKIIGTMREAEAALAQGSQFVFNEDDAF